MAKATAVLAGILLAAQLTTAAASAEIWQNRLLVVPYQQEAPPDHMLLELVRQDYEALEVNRSILRTPLTIGQRRFEHGLGTHSVSRVRVHSPEPISGFPLGSASTRTSVLPAVLAPSCSPSPRIKRRSIDRKSSVEGRRASRLDIDIPGSSMLELQVDDAGDGPSCDHADWAEAVITTESGTVIPLHEIRRGCRPVNYSKYPFSMTYDGKSSDELLENWNREEHRTGLDEGRTQRTVTWTDAKTGLKIHWTATSFADFPAVEWVLQLENAGGSTTPIIENIQALDLTVNSPQNAMAPYVLHGAKGGVPNPSQAMPTACVVDEKTPANLGSDSGRSSTRNLPFFRLDAKGETYVAAIGWSGCWKADFVCRENNRLHVTAGMEKTHFVLHPGEKVRSPRILLLRCEGDATESNSQFRLLMYRHYAARRNGQSPLPTIFCNTCFTRGGGWLNECNAENQISLINAYAPLGLEALLTDAGWFTGGWPNGAGNWDARQDAYPNGMAPVAKAALDKGMIYGLWYEPERVVAGTAIHKEHPEWCLPAGPEPQGTYLLNFGLPEVQDYFFGIVSGYMELPGFRVYRQDFNMDPLPYWRHNDAPNRQGVTEMKYIEGLYAYWDRIARTWPDSLMEECASGGHRMDLETVMRMHIHQKTDYWFDDESDQTAIFGLSQFLPNNVIVAHLNKLDTYSFHSTLASSLCLGWIADAPDFDAARGRKLIDRYKQVRHLLVGSWYPLLPCPNDYAEPHSRNVDLWLWGPAEMSTHRQPHVQWVATQYHRADLDEGLVLVFRRPDSPYRTVQVSLRGIDPQATYEVSSDRTESTQTIQGAMLADSFVIDLPQKRSSDLIVYRKRRD